MNSISKPLFKYIGGKSWLKASLISSISDILKHNKVLKIDTYVEPFSGGLGAFFNIHSVLSQYKIKKIILNDINFPIINFYSFVLNNPSLLIKTYLEIEKEFEKTFPLNKSSKKEDLFKCNEFFISIRKRFNEIKNSNVNNAKSTELAAILLFLQSHSFNGIYRENQKGEYNTPFNWSAKTFGLESIENKIMVAHSVFNSFDVTLLNTSFEELSFNSHSLYYLDPPYYNEDISENKYNKNSFDFARQEELINKIKDTNFVYSNHYSEHIINLFKEKTNKKLNIQKIARKNIISANKESRKTDKIEVLVSQHLK